MPHLRILGLKPRTVGGVVLMLAGLVVLALALWESVHYHEAVDASKAVIGALVALLGATFCDSIITHGYVTDVVSLAGAVPGGVLSVFRGGRRGGDPVAVATTAAHPVPVTVAVTVPAIELPPPCDPETEPPHEWATGTADEGVI